MNSVVVVVCVRLHTTMSSKRCSRDECPPANVKADTTVKCYNCNHEIHLPCIGIAVNASKIASPNIRFMCDQCIHNCQTSNDNNELETSVTATPKGERVTIRAIMTEVSQLRSIIENTQEKVKSIDDKTTTIAKSTDVLANRVLRPPLQQPIGNNTPSVTTPVRNRQQNSRPSFADVARFNPNGTSSTLKRKNSIDNGNASKLQKIDVPKPTMGTKASSKLSVVKQIAKPTPIQKPTFNRAIWVSGFEPSMEPSEIANYIVTETPVADTSKFNVVKLVKKDTDLNTLKYVSFKIEVNEDEYAILNDRDVWPEGVPMRPFVEKKKLGDFFPLMNTKPTSGEMETNVTPGSSSTQQ